MRQAEAPGDGGDRQSDFRAGMTDFVDPDFLREKMTGQRPGEAELRRVRLPHPLAIEGAGHGINQVAHQQPVKLVTAVERGHKINIPLVHGAQQTLDPFRLDGGGFG